MKRIFAFLLVIVVISAMAVPAFATDDYALSGEWVFNEVLSSSGLTDWGPIGEINFISNSATFNIMFWNQYRFVYRDTNNSDNEVQVASKADSYIMLPDYRIVDFGETPQNVDADFYNWFTANAKPFGSCDGSTCPANDVNADGYCDDCGLMLRLVAPVPNGWPSALPAPREDMAFYTVLTEDGVTWLYMASNDVNRVTISDANDDGYRTIYFEMPDTSATNNLQRYQLIDGEWVYSSVGSLRDFTFDETLDIEFSTVDIYDVRGELFFPLPLWAEMEQVTQGEMVNLKTEMGGTMKILVACGVGLMACLAVLSLFGKRSLIFRK